MTYVCTKCGYGGDQGGSHPMPNGAGRLCHYQPMPTRDLTPEERAEIVERFGLDEPEIRKETK